ncbi:MAG: NADH-quinone oxidoreductase subunit L [Deltaproteobacteria bacterium]|nr:NADH-quinone oxidoreductase subunit L [Deltaproteobacteria bacterium]
MKNYCWLIPVLPLVGFVFNGLPTAVGIKLSRAYVYTVACGVMLLSFLMGVGVFFTLKALPETAREFTNLVWPWIHLEAIQLDIAFLIDPLSSVMILVVTGVGFLIHIYSTGYMREDKDYARFFTYLNLFCFMMLILVMGDNLMLLFVGWEGVGLCSYLLIGFWYEHKPNGVAGMKAFIVNRIGDFGFMVGMLALFWALYNTGHATLTFTKLKTVVWFLQPQTILGVSAVTMICLCLFVGATGKSAQIPLYVWLPDAMAGPTPVSALIHAATMVTAGVYMIARLNFLFTLSPAALGAVATIGAATAFIGATIGFAQNDIKKVLAYSTVSQLGYMFLALGSGAYAAGIFHLTTHAFFKACLFLGSGSVILGMHHEQDMRLMGGLKKYMPITFMTFLTATIAIAGIAPFAGFFSKDEILWQAFARAVHGPKVYYFLWALGVLGAMGTAFYMLRCVTLTFFGTLRANDKKTRELVHGPHKDHHGHHGDLVPHEQPWNVTLPLVVLALLSLVGGFLNVPYIITHFFGGHSSGLFNEWLSPVIPLQAHHEVSSLEWVLMFKSVLVAAVCMYLGYKAYTSWQTGVDRFVKKFPRIYDAVYNKYYVDEFYHAVFVRGVLLFNKCCFSVDRYIVDALVNLVGRFGAVYSDIIGWFDNFFVDGLVNGSGSITDFTGAQLKKLQTGNIQHYAYGAVLGVVVVMILKILM